ncbi:zinc carboxypeptidase-like [Odontomachus brunneus]|uniref:zinc carboxypeptidase-like n=1 Tax=Odontomachus brunneus TaxID=486640 RepID=UPI0013F285BB|nr:zinc carboxypeptidase-like [Odontomachus brunneus]
MWKAILLCAFVGLTASEKIFYENYKLYVVIPHKQQDLDYLNIFYKYDSAREYDYWKIPDELTAPTEIMVSPESEDMFKMRMKVGMMTYMNLTNNVQKLINNTMEEDESNDIQEFINKITRRDQAINNLEKGGNEKEREKQPSSFDFTSYHTLEEIYQNLDDLAERYPKNVKIIVAGTTFEGRQIKGVKVSFKPNKAPGVFLEGGTNAREWMTPAVVMYITHQLLNNDHIKHKVRNYNWYIFPVFNPDGYVYTHTTDRLWVKNRKPVSNEFSIGTEQCIGTNLNKNWDYEWNTGGTSVQPCSNGFPGIEPFSEIETSSISKYIESIQNEFSVYFSFHSESDAVMYSPNKEMDSMANEIVMKTIVDEGMLNTDHIYVNGVERFRIPHIFKLTNTTSGSAAHYIRNKHQKSLVFSYGLHNDIYGFLQPPDLIVSTGNNSTYSILRMLTQAEYNLLFW